MKKLNLCGIIGSLSLIGGATSAIYGIDWLLVLSAILMAISLFATVFIAEKDRRINTQRELPEDGPAPFMCSRYCALPARRQTSGLNQTTPSVVIYHRCKHIQTAFVHTFVF